jgi:hypothetical protein
MYDVTPICGAFGKWPSLYWCLDHVKIIISYYFPKDVVTIIRAKIIVKCNENLYFHYFGKPSSIVFNEFFVHLLELCLFIHEIGVRWISSHFIVLERCMRGWMDQFEYNLECSSHCHVHIVLQSFKFTYKDLVWLL